MLFTRFKTLKHGTQPVTTLKKLTFFQKQLNGNFNAYCHKRITVHISIKEAMNISSMRLRQA